MHLIPTYNSQVSTTKHYAIRKSNKYGTWHILETETDILEEAINYLHDIIQRFKPEYVQMSNKYHSFFVIDKSINTEKDNPVIAEYRVVALSLCHSHIIHTWIEQ